MNNKLKMAILALILSACGGGKDATGPTPVVPPVAPPAPTAPTVSFTAGPDTLIVADTVVRGGVDY